jgi:hypothetical protein
MEWPDGKSKNLTVNYCGSFYIIYPQKEGGIYCSKMLSINLISPILAAMSATIGVLFS